ncbi:MAG TPA: TrkA C-terminal domain-containing protein, partial [Solirubrobacteraceae bacterium]
AASHHSSTPLLGDEVAELQIPPDSPARERTLAEINLPAGSIAVAVTQDREIRAASPDLQLRAGERVIVLAPTGDESNSP